jgi:hypothetical protein
MFYDESDWHNRRHGYVRFDVKVANYDCENEVLDENVQRRATKFVLQ